MEEVIRVIEGKIFECMVDAKRAIQFMEEYPIINVREESDNPFLRLVAEKPPCDTAIAVSATLEDLYLYYFNEGVNTVNSSSDRMLYFGTQKLVRRDNTLLEYNYRQIYGFIGFHRKRKEIS